MSNEFPETPILECSHCGNRTPHSRTFEYTYAMFWDELDQNQKVYEPYTWLGYACGTCKGLNVYGAFFNIDLLAEDLERGKLHPRGADMLPPPHTLSPNQPIPLKIINLYQEVWPLRHRAPAAFIGQVRRLLESICVDQNATGKDLFAKLQDLSLKGIFPGYFNQITDLLRKVGNMGAHAGDEELSSWDAELIDDFFRSIIDYVYIAPARIKRMEHRLKAHDK